MHRNVILTCEVNNAEFSNVTNLVNPRTFLTSEKSQWLFTKTMNFAFSNYSCQSMTD
jgi:hypothetical protein